MIKLNFKDYLEKNGYGAMKLDEGLKELKPLIWQNMNLLTALKVAEYSPSWTPDFSEGKVIMDFSDHQNRLNWFRDAVNRYFRQVYNVGTDQDDIWRKDVVMELRERQAKTSFEFKMTPPEKTDAEKETGVNGEQSYQKRRKEKFQQEFRQINKAVVAEDPKLMRFVRYDKNVGDRVQITGQEEAARLFRIMKRIDSGKDATENEVNEFLSTGNKQAGGTTVTVKGNFNTLLVCYYIYDYIISDPEADATGFDDSGVREDDFFQAMEYDFNAEADGYLFFGKQNNGLVTCINSDNQINSYDKLIGMMRKNGHDFEKDVEMNLDPDDTTRWLLSRCNKIMSPDWYKNERAALAEKIKGLEQALNSDTVSAEDKTNLTSELKNVRKSLLTMDNTGSIDTPDKLFRYLDSIHIAIRMNSYQDKRRQIIASIETRKKNAENAGQEFDLQKAKAEIPASLSEVRLISDLCQVLNVKIKASDQPPVFGNACAERRMKLFRAAEHKGATILTSKNWVVCILDAAKDGTLKAGEQGKVFGRNKPKVEPGDKTRKRIIASANMEDWEKNADGTGITAADRVIRDGDGPFVADGIGYDKVRSETTWCTATTGWGASIGVFNPWEKHGAMSPDRYFGRGNMRIVFMDCRDGALYQAGGDSLFGESDATTGIVAATNTSGFAAFVKVLETYSELDSLLDMHGFKQRYIGSVDGKTDEQLFEDAVRANLVTKNGGLIIRDRADYQTYRKIQGKFTEYLPYSANPDGMFRVNDMTRAGMSAMIPVNCKKLKTANGLFRSANINGKIILKNTGHIYNMSYMFACARLEGIEGLDTRSANTIECMFMNCRPIVYKFIQLPEFDLQKCVNMSDAFSGSAIRFITLKNTENMKVATNAFKSCFMLEKFPEGIRFEKVTSIKQLASDITLSSNSKFSDDFNKMFSGCAVLPRKMGAQKFREAVDKLAKWYREREQIQDDPNTFIIRSREDVDSSILKSLYYYKTVKIDPAVVIPDLFNALIGVKIRQLDVSGCKSLDRLFNGCVITQIDEIVGTDDAESAEQMFYCCTFNDPPAMSFRNLKTQMNVYKNMHVPNYVPVVLFGNNVKPPTEWDSENYVQICNQFLDQTSPEWQNHFEPGKIVKELFRDRYEALRNERLKQIKKDGRGFLILTDEIRDIAFEAIVANAKEIKGIVIDFSVDNGALCNKTEKLFYKREFNGTFPVVDFNHRNYSCVYIFEFFKCERFAGFINTEKIKFTNYMFKNCITNYIPVFDTSGIEDATGMFSRTDVLNNSTIFGNSFVDQEWNFENVEQATRMFDRCPCTIDLSKLRFGKTLYCIDYGFRDCKVKAEIIDLAAPTIHSAFEHAIFINKTVRQVNLPHAKPIPTFTMFLGVSGLEQVLSIKMPQADQLDYMFSGCRDLKQIGTIDAPLATSVQGMFDTATNLKSILVPTLPAVRNTTNMFRDCPLEQVFGENGEAFTTYAKFVSAKKVQ